MGTTVKQTRFSKTDHQRFAVRLQENLAELEQLLANPKFGCGAVSLGTELELSLIDGKGNASWCNVELVQLANDPCLALELNKYNIEYNLSHMPAAGRPFSDIAQEINGKLVKLRQLADQHKIRVIAIGILPTLTRKDIKQEVMSAENRYRVLTDAIIHLRGAPFTIDIRGADSLYMKLDCLTAEGATNSFQIHCKVNPEQFAGVYNAAQMATAPALAISTNSPTFLQKRLWEETRVVLFKQAVETRLERKTGAHQMGRTSLGSGWLEGSALEHFRQSVTQFPVLIPECSKTSAFNTLQNGETPELAELRLHHGSVWYWNRGVYDPIDGGHLRIEMRALPSGPTSTDMAASAAFLVGLTHGLHDTIGHWSQIIPFEVIKQNFYRAAEQGMDALLTWPCEKSRRLTKQPVWMVMDQLIPLAAAGLAKLQVDDAEIKRMMSLIEARVAKKITGARWQLDTLKKLEQKSNRNQALHQMLEIYSQHSLSGDPVHQWALLK